MKAGFDMHRRRGVSAFVCAVIGMLLALPAPAAVVSFDQPAMDVWMYDNGFNRGFRENAPVFGGPIGAGNGSDDRLAQLVMGWDTAGAGIPAGLPSTDYAVTRVVLRVTQINGEVFRYDPTYDGYRTYLPANDAEHLADADTGRPIEVYGVGFRNGYTGLAVSGSVSGSNFGEATTTISSGAGEYRRHVFAYSPTAPRADGDVSENVSERFDPTPFAIGLTTDVNPGQWVPADAEFTFSLNLADPAILAYVREALATGQLGLMLSTLHSASFEGQPGAQSYPRFYTRDYYDYVDFVVPQLEIEYTLVPEPSPSQALLLIAALFATGRAWRRRTYFS